MWRRRLMVFSISPVAHQLHPTHHLPHGKEAQDLGENHTTRRELSSIDVADRGKYTLGRHAGWVLRDLRGLLRDLLGGRRAREDGRRGADGVDEWLGVRLKGLEGA